MPDPEETKTTTTVKTDSEKDGQKQPGGDGTITKPEKSGDDQS